MNQLLPRLILMLFFWGHALNGNGQKLAADTSASGAGMLSFFQGVMGTNVQLFNGPEYEDYPFAFSAGHPYFLSDIWTIGSVAYRGSLYHEVRLLYNLEQDKLIIPSEAGLVKIELQPEQVDSFNIGGHRFLHVCAHKFRAGNLRCGYYEVVVEGSANLFVKRLKNIQTQVGQKVEMYVVQKSQYYLGKEGNFTQVNSQKELLRLLSDQKKELQQFIKRNRIRYRRQPEAAMARIIECYNQLKSKA